MENMIPTDFCSTLYIYIPWTTYRDCTTASLEFLHPSELIKESAEEPAVCHLLTSGHVVQSCSSVVGMPCGLACLQRAHLRTPQPYALSSSRRSTYCRFSRIRQWNILQCRQCHTCPQARKT